ncbi:Multidrug resistance protein NorM [Vibrio stylophorae]|uniref:Multidrug resistance protein NorM n=1 Tax=Vibrio stylophorae TaxID=659351 RepID=A0ABM8ZQ05_9VIBR|nr:MATE family efflux transporter [Vibrio stylophorae]CAH0532386.1 Multidrug resistance protein NorM [Vibrio stylophorae]
MRIKWAGCWQQLWQLSFPIALQTAVFSSKGLVDTLMLSQIGGHTVAAIGFASKIQLVISFLLMGIGIGGAQAAAQCWGRRQQQGEAPFQATIQLTLGLSLVIALLAIIILWPLSGQLMQLASDDHAIIQSGSIYLTIIAPTYLLYAWTNSMAVGLRILNQAMIATVVSLIGVVANILLNWLLIRGFELPWLGLHCPALGIKGAAWGTLISALLETAVLWGWLHYRRHLLCQKGAHIRQQCHWQRCKLLLYLSYTAALNCTLWALGVFVCHAILARVEPQLLLVLGLLGPIESLLMAMMIGSSQGASILIGQHIGANQQTQLHRDQKSCLQLAWLIGGATCVLMLLLYPWIEQTLVSQHPSVLELTANIYQLIALAMILRSVTMMLMIGLLRAGGDVRFCFWLDFMAQWFFLLPSMWLCGRYFDWSAPAVFTLLLIEELGKMLICQWRLRQGRWQRDLTATSPA